MRTSMHAQVRMAQRNITPSEAALILDSGTPFGAPGGASRYVVTRKERSALIEYFRDQIRRLEKAGEKAVVVSRDGAIITVEHLYTGRRLRQTRPERARRARVAAAHTMLEVLS
jgi:hypothetical protein